MNIIISLCHIYKVVVLSTTELMKYLNAFMANNTMCLQRALNCEEMSSQVLLF